MCLIVLPLNFSPDSSPLTFVSSSTPHTAMMYQHLAGWLSWKWARGAVNCTCIFILTSHNLEALECSQIVLPRSCYARRELQEMFNLPGQCRHVVGLQQALKGQLEPNVICWGVLCLVHPSVTYFFRQHIGVNMQLRKCCVISLGSTLV